MKNAQFTLDDFSAFMKRRKLPFILPFIIITSACILGAFIIPKRYMSSTTIMVQGDAVLNPLVSYTMAVAMQNDDRLRDFNEIVYSTPIVESLMDSLGMQPTSMSQQQRQQAMKAIIANIKTDRNGSDSFTISFLAAKPDVAQKAVGVLAHLFIQARLKIENAKNNFAVQFFSQRSDSIRDKFEKSQEQLVGVMRQHVSALPESDREVYTQIDKYDDQINALQRDMSNYRQAQQIIQKALTAGESKIDMQSLYQLPLLGVPYADQLQTALTKYDGLLHKYTQEYPAVQDARTDVFQLLDRTKEVVQSGIGTKQDQIWALEKQRNDAINTVKQATVQQSQDQDVQSNFNIYKELYNDMKIKLEQAQTSRDLGENGAREFLVIDPPELPTSPAKPNKPLMIAGGFSLGLILGLLSAGLAEILDSRIRTSIDVEMYNKPVIAYLPDTANIPKRAK